MREGSGPFTRKIMFKYSFNCCISCRMPWPICRVNLAVFHEALRPLYKNSVSGWSKLPVTRVARKKCSLPTSILTSVRGIDSHNVHYIKSDQASTLFTSPQRLVRRSVNHNSLQTSFAVLQMQAYFDARFGSCPSNFRSASKDRLSRCSRIIHSGVTNVCPEIIKPH